MTRSLAKAQVLLPLALLVLLPGCGQLEAEDSAKAAATEIRLAAIEKKLDEVLAAVRPGKPVGREGLAHVEERIRRVEQKVDDVLTAMEFLAVDVDAIKRTAWDTMMALQSADGPAEPEAPDEYKRLFEPETRAVLTKAAAVKGIVLHDTRVEVPGVIIQRSAPLEFFAVSAGGKEHEAVVALTGILDEEGPRMSGGLAGLLNACILALGYEKGTPVRASRDGKVLPPEGEAIHLYIEWDGEDGVRVRARAEDLVYNLETKSQMERGKWVYVGSRFERDYTSGEVIYMADVTGDIVATYSWPNTIIDNTTSEGADDVYYTCLTPRIPEVGTKVMMVFSREPMDAKEFPALDESGVREGENGGESDD